MADKTWNGSTGTWATSASWSPTGVPLSTDNVFINAGTVTVAGQTCAALTIGGTATITGTSLTVTTNMSVNGSAQFTYSGSSTLAVGGTLNIASASGRFTHSGAGGLTVGASFTNSGTYNQTNTAAVLTFTGGTFSGTVNWGTNSCYKVTVAKTSTTILTFNNSGALNCTASNSTVSAFTFTTCSNFTNNCVINTNTLINNGATTRTWNLNADVNLTGSFSGAIVSASQTTCTYASKTGTIRFQNSGSTSVDSTLAFGGGILATCPNVSIETGNTTTRVLVTGSVENLWTSGNYFNTGSLTVFGNLQDSTANCTWTGATITKPATASGATSTTNCTARFGTITFAGGATAATTFNSACTHTVTFCRASTIAVSTTALGVTYNFNNIEVATALNLSLPTSPSTPCTVTVSKARPFSGAAAVTTTIGQAISSSTSYSTVYLEDYDIPSTITHNTQYLIIGGLNSNSVRCTTFTTGALTRYFDIGAAGRTSYLVTRSNQTGEPGTGSCSISGTGFNNNVCNGGFVVAGSGSHAFGTPTYINALIVILRSGSATLSGTIARLEVEASGGATGTITINGPYAGDSIKQVSGNPGPISGLNLTYALSNAADTPQYSHNFAGLLGTVTVNSSYYAINFDNVNCSTLTIAGSGTTLSSDVSITNGTVGTVNFQPTQTGSTATSNCYIYGGTFTNFNVNYTTNPNIRTLNIQVSKTDNLVTGTLTHTAGTIYISYTVAVQNYTAAATGTKQIDWSSNSDSILKINGSCTIPSILTYAAAGDTNSVTGSAYAGSFWLAGSDTCTGYVWTSTTPSVRYNTIISARNSTLTNWYTQNCTFIEDANSVYPTAYQINYTDGILGSNTLSTNLSGLTLQSVLTPRDPAYVKTDCKTTVPFAAFNHNTVNSYGYTIDNIYAANITLGVVGTVYTMGATVTDVVKSNNTITLSAATTYNMYYVECVNLILNGAGATYIVDGVRYLDNNLNPTTGTVTHTAGTLALSVTGNGYDPVLSACNFTSNTGTRTIDFKDNSYALIQTLGTGALNISYSGLTTIFQAGFTPFAGFLHNSTGSINTGAVAPTTASAASIYILKGCTLPSTLYAKNFSNYNYPKIANNYPIDGYNSGKFNGSTDYLSTTTTFSLATATTPFTMEAWVYFNSFSGAAIASTAYAGSGPLPFVMGMGSGVTTAAGATPWFGYYTGSTWVSVVQSSTSLSVNTWYHLAYVYTGSSATIYANGTSIGTATVSTWQTTSQAGFYIGRRWDTAVSPYFNGYISNFRFVIGTAVYTGTFTPPKSPLFATQGSQTNIAAITDKSTVLLTCQSSSFRDNSYNSVTITTNGTPLVSDFSFISPYGSGYPINTSNFSVELYGDFSIGGELLASQTGTDTVVNRAGWQYLAVNLATTTVSDQHTLTTQPRVTPSPYTYSYPMYNISTVRQITLPSTFLGTANIIGRLQSSLFYHNRGSLSFTKYYNYDTSGTYSSQLYVNTTIGSSDTTNTKTHVYNNLTTSGADTSIFLLATTGTVWDFPYTNLLSSNWQIIVNVLGGIINHGTNNRKTTTQPSFDFTNFTSSFTLNPNTSFNVGSLLLKNYNIPSSSVFNVGGPVFTYDSPSNTIGANASINLIDGGNRKSSGSIIATSFTNTTGQLSYSSITNGIVAQIGQVVQITGSFYNTAFKYISNTITAQSVSNASITVYGTTSGQTSGGTVASGLLQISGGSLQRQYASGSVTIQYTVSNPCRITYYLGNNGSASVTAYSNITISSSLGFYVADSTNHIGKNSTVDVPGNSSNYTITITANTGVSGQEAISGYVSWVITSSSSAVTGNIPAYNGTNGLYAITAIGSGVLTLGDIYSNPITTVTGTIQGPTFITTAISSAPAGSDVTLFTSNTTAIYPAITCEVSTNLKLSSNSFKFNTLSLSKGIVFDAYTNTSTYGLICYQVIRATENSTLNITGKTLEIQGSGSGTDTGIQFGNNGDTNTNASGNLIGSTSSNLVFSGIGGTGGFGSNQYIKFSKYSSSYGGKLTNNLQYIAGNNTGFVQIELEGITGLTPNVYPVHFFDISFGFSTGALFINSYYGVGVKTFNLINGVRLQGVNGTYSASNTSMILANNSTYRVSADQLIINNFNVAGGNGWYYGNNSNVSGSYTGWQNGLPPTFSLSRTPTGNINEGSTITITLSTTNLNNGTLVPFTISGVDNTDIRIDGVSTLSGNFTMSGSTASATASITITAVADFTDESSVLQYETITLTLSNGTTSISFAIYDTSKVPTYSLSRSPAGDITEGNSVTITLTATSIPAGTAIPYTLSGTATNNTDYTVSSGQFTLGTTTVVNDVLSATSALTFNTIWDYVSESTETVTLITASTLGGTNASITFNILNLLHPTYSLTANPTSVTEGGSFTITLTTTDVANGTNVPYTISGTGITASDFSIGGSSSFTGNFNIQNNTSTITVTTLADYFSESSENLRLTLDTIGTFIDVPIADYYKTRTWSLATDKTTVSEGESFTITLTTTNVFDNTLVPYTISSGTSGTITTGDFTPASLTGNFTVVGGTAQQTFNIVVDAAIEGVEIFVLTLNSPANSSISVSIRDAVASAGNFLILFE